MSSSKNHEVSVLFLVPLRLFIGLSFLISGQAKVAMGNWGAAFETTLSNFVSSNLDNAYAFYRPFLESFVLPNAGKFAVLVAWGELLVGASIFVGLFTRFGAAVGMFLILNYAFAVGLAIWLPSMEAVYLWAIFTLLVCSAGRAMGADQILRSNRKIRLFT